MPVKVILSIALPILCGLSGFKNHLSHKPGNLLYQLL